jgi:hypothetical protein
MINPQENLIDTSDYGSLECGLASGRNTHEFQVNLFDFFVKSQQKNRVFGNFSGILRQGAFWRSVLTTRQLPGRET